MLGHKIPITKEVAAVIQTQVAWVKKHYRKHENPQGWLFPASKKRRESRRFALGETLVARGFNESLNRLAVKYQIKDEQGNIFHFKLHAFRHTKAVELINNGMSLVMVQQWMAHASPEMTLIYAKFSMRPCVHNGKRRYSKELFSSQTGSPILCLGRNCFRWQTQTPLTPNGSVNTAKM